MLTNTVKAHLSQLVFVDIQTKLQSAMSQTELAFVINNCSILAQASTLLEIKTVLTEQYSKGLGATIPELLSVLPTIKPIEKLHFSAMGEPRFTHQLTKERPHLILVGMEAHICILQTALDLIAQGKQVFVVEDAVISRNPGNKANALTRMREAGCVITNTESVLFEWLGKAEGDAFKTISRLIR